MNLVEFLNSRSRNVRLIGIVLIILGILAMFAPFATGLSIAIMTGILLMASGVVQLVLVFQARPLSRGVILLLFALLSLAAGVYMISQPGVALATLTLLLAAYFVATGILEFIAALQARPQSGWGWLSVSAVLSFLLGVMIWSQFPLSGVWAIGLLVGIRLLTAGWLLVVLGAAGSQVAKTAADEA